MFVSYKSQSTGNQGEASDIIAFYITQVASLPCGGEGQLKTPPSGQQDEKDEDPMLDSIGAGRVGDQTSFLCAAGLGSSHPCPPGLWRPFIISISNDLQRPGASKET